MNWRKLCGWKATAWASCWKTSRNAKLVNQRDVVRNERRQKIENEPYGVADEGLFHLLFPKEHPYHADVIDPTPILKLRA